MKKNRCIKPIIILLLIILTLGCSDEKTYKAKGISITMMKGLFYKQHNSATIYYENDEIFVIGLEEKFKDLMPLDINNETTIEEYVEEIFINREESYDLLKEDNLYYYTYEYDINDKTYFYVSTIHKSNEGFWICNFSCEKNNKDKYFDLFIKWGKSIKFY